MATNTNKELAVLIDADNAQAGVTALKSVS